MPKTVSLLFLLIISGLAQGPVHRPLPTNQLLTTVPGNPARTNSFPAAIAVSPGGRYAVLLNDGYGTAESGFRQSLAVIDLRTHAVRDFPDPRLGLHSNQSYFLGLAFSPGGRELFASIASLTDPAGAKPRDLGNGIAVYRFRAGRLAPRRFLKIAPPPLPSAHWSGLAQDVIPGRAVPFPAGLAVFRRNGHERILVAGDLSDAVYLLGARSGRLLHRFDVSDNAYIPGSFPYAVAVTHDGHYGYCSLWNASTVVKLDLQRGRVLQHIRLQRPVQPSAPGSHPGALLLSLHQHRLFVALANRDRVAVVDTRSGRIRQWLSTRLRDLPFGGSIPMALAQDAGGDLFAADAGLNAVAVFRKAQLAEARTHTPLISPNAFIPTEWYPTALAARGDQLLIATGKGKGTGPNSGPATVRPRGSHRRHPYIAWLLRGSVAALPISAIAPHAVRWTAEVAEDNRAQVTPAEAGAGWQTPIRHIIYIIRENRTYDQILGDLSWHGQPVGDGDPRLTWFGKRVTPNAHKLALQFGVLDNFEVSAEVSAGGHVWSTAATSSDYTEQTWQIGYRNGQRDYDSEGDVEGGTPLLQKLPDVDEPGTGYIWTDLAQHGLSYRHYGEFITTRWCDAPAAMKKRHNPKQGTPIQVQASQACDRRWIKPGAPLPSNVGDPRGSASPWPWKIPVIAGNVATMPELRGHFDPRYADFRLDYPDQLRADEFLNEFRGFVAARRRGSGQRLPRFVLLRLPNDHTFGTKPGMPTPAASVADNDLALGRVVEAVSHSPYWNNTAIFVLEDDAQSGADHVDAHRSVAFVISKYSPRTAAPFVDHHFYTTVNLLRTMEAILGLPPMNHNDATARVMRELFSGPGTQPPFVADESARRSGLIYRVSSRHSAGAQISAHLDFSHADAADPWVLDGILRSDWQQRRMRRIAAGRPEVRRWDPRPLQKQGKVGDERTREAKN